MNAAIVGHLGPAVLAGVGLGSMISGCFNWIFGFLSILTVPKIASFLAKGQQAKATEHVAQATLFAVAMGSLSAMALYNLAPSILAGASHRSPLCWRFHPVVADVHMPPLRV